MNKVDFSYSGENYFVQCNNDDKMKDIVTKFLNKIGKNGNNLYYLYNGQIMNEELIFEKCANALDKSRNYMNVLVIEGQDSDEDSNLKKSIYVICPTCNENAFLTIEDFKIVIHGCKNGHKIENIKINEFENTQYIDQSKIKCDECENLKSETRENKLYICYTCKKNLCPKCKDSHDETHTNIIDYDEKQFYCIQHFNKYEYYCDDCKKDLCNSCKNEHQSHNIIEYNKIIPDIGEMKKTELADTKEKIYELKTIINNMINQLNNLNKNMDNYFEIDHNIISNFDKKKRNYSILQNINNMKKYNDNFMGNITEIIKNDNLKIQFNSVVNIQVKMDFEKKEKIEKIEKTDNNENNENDIQKNTLDNKHEDIQLNKMKELQIYKIKNTIEGVLVLNDKRIFTIQRYTNEDGKKKYKICVYTVTNNGFVCDINIDDENITNLFLMDDGNVILRTYNNKIRLIKVNKNSIENILSLDKEVQEMERLLNNKFLMYIKDDTGKTVQSPFFAQGKVLPVYEFNYCIYSYENNQFIREKNINDIYGERKSICQINENEFALAVKEEGKIYGFNNFIIFYDFKTYEKISTIKLSGDEYANMFYIGNNNLLVTRKNKTILIDTKKKSIINDFKFKIKGNCMNLNESLFISYERGKLSLYEFVDSKTIKFKEEQEIDFDYYLFLQYYGNQFIAIKNKTIIIYG